MKELHFVLIDIQKKRVLDKKWIVKLAKTKDSIITHVHT